MNLNTYSDEEIGNAFRKLYEHRVNTSYEANPITGISILEGGSIILKRCFDNCPERFSSIVDVARFINET